MHWTLEAHTAGDGYRWHYRRYAPDAVLHGAAPRGEVVCIHGIQSHAGWYEGSCSRLAAAGYEVSFLDRRGSGANSQGRGDAPGFRRLVDDIAELLSALPAGRRKVLLAISWGAKLAAALARRRPGLVDAYAFLCPGFCPKVGLSRRERLGVLAARLFAPQREFDVPLTEAGLFTATPAFLDFIQRDPLALRRATAQLLLESARLDAYLRWFPPRLSCPVLLMLAGHDRIIDNARTREFVGRIAASALTTVEYPDAHHTLEFEPGMPFVADLLSWLTGSFDNSPGAT